MPDHGDVGAPRAKFHAMTEGTQEDWMIIASQFSPSAPYARPARAGSFAVA